MLERLQKIIARAGIASRRHAEELIRSGQVRVNGQVVTELGAKADPDRDRVEAAGQVADQPVAPAYYLLYKPSHVVATLSDPEGRATLRHVLRGLAGGVFPVGRLDYEASGLILLTTDGRLADRMLKASSRIPKVYWFKVKGALGHDLLRQIGHAAHARLRLLRGPAAAKRHADNPWYEAEVGDARGDSLRRELFAAGHPVEKIKRVKLGPLELGDLAEGHYRELTSGEVTRLEQAIERAEKAPRPVRRRRPQAWRPDRAFRPDHTAGKSPAAADPRRPQPSRPDRPPRPDRASRSDRKSPGTAGPRRPQPSRPDRASRSDRTAGKSPGAAGKPRGSGGGRRQRRPARDFEGRHGH